MGGAYASKVCRDCGREYWQRNNAGDILAGHYGSPYCPQCQGKRDEDADANTRRRVDAGEPVRFERSWYKAQELIEIERQFPPPPGYHWRQSEFKKLEGHPGFQDHETYRDIVLTKGDGGKQEQSVKSDPPRPRLR
jgi:hypothetical protein